MPEFVILFHEMPPQSDRASHWDLMLLDGDKLLTWALENEPSIGNTTAGRQLPDHDLRFLTFEGKLSGDRGCVRRTKAGIFEWTTEYDEDGWEIRMFFADSIWTLRASRTNDQWFAFVFS